MESRWLLWVGPGVIALGVIGSLATATLGAAQRPWTPRPCDSEAAEQTAAAALPGPAVLSDLGGQAWFRMDPTIDDLGTLRGQRISLGLLGRHEVRTMELPPESFATGPFGRILLIGSDDGSVSRLQAVDVVAGCAWALADERSVIRRATIDPTGERVFEARVDRGSRADLGVWSRPLDGLMPASAVLPPLDPDGRFGRTFSTEFAWAIDGRGLAVQSCGEVACRTRIIGFAGRPDRELAEPDLGLIVGFDGDQLVTYGACLGRPCPIVVTDLTSGERQILAAEGDLAVLLATSDGPRLVHEAVADSGPRLYVVGLDGGSASDLGPLPAGLRVQAALDGAGSATRLPIDWILLAPDGRPPIDGEALRPVLRHLPDGATVQLDEVVR